MLLQVAQYDGGGSRLGTLILLLVLSIGENGNGCWIRRLDGTSLLDVVGNRYSFRFKVGVPLFEAVERIFLKN